MTIIGSHEYHGNIKGQVIAKGLRYQNACCFNYWKFGHLQFESLAKPLKVSDLKMTCGFTVRNMVLSTRKVSASFLGAKAFLNIKQK